MNLAPANLVAVFTFSIGVVSITDNSTGNIRV